MKILFLLILISNVHTELLSQAIGISIDGSVPHPSSILDIKSSTRGLLIPRTSTTTRLSILNGANGLTIYDTTVGSFWFMNGGVWIESGRLDVPNNNAFFGYQSGKAIPLGDFNAGFGTEALFSNTTGTGNTALGQSSMHNNTTGNNNTTAGMFSLFFNSTGSHNTAIGNNAMILNQTGYSNVAIGSGALFHVIDGHNLVAIGDSALFNLTSSNTNVAVGSKALFSAVTGGVRNTAIGTNSLYANTIGIDNTAVGLNALGSNSTGFENTAIGGNALGSTTGFSNVAVGYWSMIDNNTGNENVAVGVNAVIPGSNCTVLGFEASVTSNTQFSTAIGSNATVSCSNCLALGGANASTRTKVGINVAAPFTDLHVIQQSSNNSDNTRGIRLQSPNGNHWRVFLDPSSNYVFQYNNNLFSYIEPVGGAYINSSDERLKKDISSLDRVMDKLLLLQPKTYQYTTSTDANRYSYGFLAQEVEKIFPDFVFSSENGMKGIAYSNFSVIAVKAIQEQQLQIQEQKEQINNLEKINFEQQQQLIKLMLRIEALEKKSS